MNTAKCGCVYEGFVQMCKLHAAAPDLLEACKKATLTIAMLKDRYRTSHDKLAHHAGTYEEYRNVELSEEGIARETMTELRTAIAKATNNERTD